METVAIYLVVTFTAGLLALAVRQPPLLGFLAAGFILNGIGVERVPELTTIAHLGVTLLLFGVGLKLELRTLLRREVWLTASVHMLGSVAIGAVFLALLGFLGFAVLEGWTWRTVAMVGFALSFSSTVLVVKVLAERGETQSLYGRIAIGVLIMQDVAAAVFIGIVTGVAPSPWALLLVLLVPMTRALRWIWDRIGHDELQVLFGIVVAIVPGYALFESVGLRGDLGAVIVGMLLASHPKAEELARSLFGLKELLLIGFFVSIGLEGMPTLESLALSVLLLVLLPVNGFLYALLLSLQRMRPRTAVMAGLSLMNDSEFALIVVSMGVSGGLLDEDWLVVVSVTVALSFVISTLVNRRVTLLSPLLENHTPAPHPESANPLDRPIDIAGAQALVFGMGRTGSGAYRTLTRVFGLQVVGIDADDQVVIDHRRGGWDVREGDATDLDFWDRVTSHSHIRLAILAMPLHEMNLFALERLRSSGFPGVVGSVAQYDDDIAELVGHGADTVFHLYADVGASIATAAAEAGGLEAREDA